MDCLMKIILVCISLLLFLYSTSQFYSSQRVTTAYRFLSNGKNTIDLNSVQTYDDQCQWHFLNYTPSAWESMWLENIDEFQNNVCEHLYDTHNLNNTITALQRLVELQTFGRNRVHDAQSESDEILSKMFYRQVCHESRTDKPTVKVEVAQLIEPLIGLLRDPFTMCRRLNSTFAPSSVYDGAIKQSKRFLLLSISAPFSMYSPNHELQSPKQLYTNTDLTNGNILPWMYQRHNFVKRENLVDPKSRKVILLDLGSSYFSAWKGDSSASAGQWFYEYFKRFNTKFDRIIAFEFSPLKPKTAWNQLPDDVVPIFTLINVGVRANKGKFNPWKLLQTIAQPSDHVIVKLDIDTPSIERPLIDQVLNDSSIHSLIDEFFFEHHVTVKEMIRSWKRPPGTLKDSYVLFKNIRELGIRMHSWP